MRRRQPDLIEERCPSCGGHVAVEPDCPGYGEPPSVRVCYPTWECGNATLFECRGRDTDWGDDRDADGCGWWYRDGDRGLRTSRTPMAARPDWAGKYVVSLRMDEE